MGRDKFPKQSLGVLHRKIKESRVLLVGAGGIGCELLKNLVLTGFGEVHIIDLDTIDLSNLNRQFLFRHEHIKKPKALVAKEVAQRFNPNVKLEAYHANIKESHFNIDWFSSFEIVFNALDNLEARQHVNKMCLAADVPLIESGTTGFNGQVQVIIRGKTACYDCSEKPAPKGFPICTIRSTPSQPIHCIVWAKSYLLPELFGVSEDDTPELDNSVDANNADEVEKLQEEAQALMKIRESMGSEDFAKKVFDKVYKEDIERLQNMEGMWKLRKPPEALSFDELSSQTSSVNPAVSQNDQRAWTRVETVAIFTDSLSRLSKRLLTEQTEALKTSLPKPVITFDKDDTDTLDFVTAASNLRSIVFNIEPKSKFNVKQMAGNIIPAIATTNAMIAGLCVMQAFKVMKGEYGRTKMIFLNRGAISAGTFEPPNPDCAVCGVAMSRVRIDPEKATLGDLVEGVLKLELGYGDEMTVLSSQGMVYDPDEVENLDKRLEDLNIRGASFVTVQDDEEAEEGQEPRVDLQIAIEIGKDLPEGKAIILTSKPEIARRAKRKLGLADMNVETNGDTNKDTNGAVNGVNLNGEERKASTNGEDTSPAAVTKRKRDADEAELDGGIAAKKAETAKMFSAGQETVIIDDGDEGAIEID